MRTSAALSIALLITSSACRSKEKSLYDYDINRPELVTDIDADGYEAEEDCDDNNYFSHPGADEICDGIDNNCDGQIDEEVSITFYADSDVDGFGDNTSLIEACEQPQGYVPVANDCNDSNGEVYPAAEEVCEPLRP